MSDLASLYPLHREFNRCLVHCEINDCGRQSRRVIGENVNAVAA
jgi:hypothetical protein